MPHKKIGYLFSILFFSFNKTSSLLVNKICMPRQYVKSSPNIANIGSPSSFAGVVVAVLWSPYTVTCGVSIKNRFTDRGRY